MDLDKGLSNPRDLKRKLARKIVEFYHGKELSIKAENDFDAIFIKKDEPEDIPEYILSGSIKIIDLLVENNMVSSNGEARRMIKQGAVRINKEKVEDIHYVITNDKECVIKVGKRKFLRIVKWD